MINFAAKQREKMNFLKFPFCRGFFLIFPSHGVFVYAVNFCVQRVKGWEGDEISSLKSFY